jgi:very-short-patch-repair endonuclease
MRCQRLGAARRCRSRSRPARVTGGVRADFPRSNRFATARIKSRVSRRRNSRRRNPRRSGSAPASARRKSRCATGRIKRCRPKTAATLLPSPGGGGSAGVASRGGVTLMAGSRVLIKRSRLARARSLRAATTPTEILLWRRLRGIETKGTHFRRQVSIGPYVVDFACMAAYLVIELDGFQHNEDARRAKDERRTRWLESEGYRVIRFWNNDLMQNMEGVLETIYAALYGSRHAEMRPLKHTRRKQNHPTPARVARRPSPSRGG